MLKGWVPKKCDPGLREKGAIPPFIFNSNFWNSEQTVPEYLRSCFACREGFQRGEEGTCDPAKFLGKACALPPMPPSELAGGD